MRLDDMMRYPPVYFVMLITGFLVIFGYSMLRPFLPVYAWQLDPTGILAGFTISSYFFARTFIELPSGVISDRIGRRTPIILGTCLATVGALICTLSSKSIQTLILGLAVWGLGAALVFTNNTALIIDMFEPQVRGRALGNFQGIEFIGSFIGAPIGGFLADYFLGYGLGYAAMFYVIAASLVGGFLVAFISKGLKRADTRSGRGSTQLPFRESLKGLKNLGLLMTCVANFSRMFVMQGAITTTLPIYLRDFLNVSYGLVGTVIGMRTGGMILSTLISGHLSDRFGRKPIILSGVILQGLFMYLYTLVGSWELIILVAIVEGFGSGMNSVPLIALMSEQVAPEYRGCAVGLFRTFMDVGAVTGPVVAMMVQLGYNIYTPFVMGAVLLFATIPTLLGVRERRNSKLIRVLRDGQNK